MNFQTHTLSSKYDLCNPAFPISSFSLSIFFGMQEILNQETLPIVSLSLLSLVPIPGQVPQVHQAVLAQVQGILEAAAFTLLLRGATKFDRAIDTVFPK